MCAVPKTIFAVGGRLFSPGRPAIHIKLHQFNRTIRGELTDNREPVHERSCSDQDPVLLPPLDQFGQIVEASSEPLYDPQ